MNSRKKNIKISYEKLAINAKLCNMRTKIGV